MPRQPGGTLLPPGADGIHRGRVTKRHADGTVTRPVYALGTADKALAKRKLAALVAAVEAGNDPADAPEALAKPDTVRASATAWLEARERQGIKSVKDERGGFTREILPAIGNVLIRDVRPAHVRGIWTTPWRRGCGAPASRTFEG